MFKNLIFKIALLLILVLPHNLAVASSPFDETFEAMKTEAIERCRQTMGDYGASLVKVCVDEDIKSYKALQGYPESQHSFILSCKKRMNGYGWNLIKVCADEDIKADKALQSY